MPTQVWADWNMRPVHPATAQNPITRIVNMRRRSDGMLERRASIASFGSVGALPTNHKMVELGGKPHLVVKAGSSIRALAPGGGSITLGVAPASDPPENGGVPSAKERGSFAVYSDELYYCDSLTLWAWDGNGSGVVRRPGVQGLEGLYYHYDPPEGLGFAPAGAGSTPAERDAYYNPQVIGDLPNPSDPSESDPYLLNGPEKGQKTLNTAFALAYYDPKRRIYGRRCRPFAYPYVFGPAVEGQFALSDERTQYSKFIHTPAAPAGHPDYQVAVFSTIGMNLLTNTGSLIFGQPGSHFFFIGGQHRPAMSNQMAEVLFLERIAPAGAADVELAKDDATLVASGRYVDHYARPVPAKFLAILANGTALYFFPRIVTGSGSLSAGVLQTKTGNYCEFSIGHPEQIARSPDENRQSVSALPDLVGSPLALVQDSRHQILVTTQALYQIGFTGTHVQLHPLANGRGIRSIGSLVTSSIGVLWFGEEGVIWLRGGSVVILDKRLGFGEWFDGLNGQQKSKVVIGVSEGTNEIIALAENIDGGGQQRGFCFNYETGYAYEFEPGGSVGEIGYAAFLRDTAGGTAGSKLLFFSQGSARAYPSSSGESFSTLVELWLNDQLEKPKTVRSIMLDLGPRAGSILVAVTAFESGDPDEDNEKSSSRNATLTLSGSFGGQGRKVLPHFDGMRGKLIRVLIAGPSEDWSLARVAIEYDVDEADDARSR